MQRFTRSCLTVALALIVALSAYPSRAVPVRPRTVHTHAHTAKLNRIHASAHAAGSRSRASSHAKTASARASRGASSHGKNSSRINARSARAGKTYAGRSLASAGAYHSGRSNAAVLRVRRGALRAHRHGRASESFSARLQEVRLAIPAPLRGSHESLVHQNVMAQNDGLERILDDADLQDRIGHGSLVPVPLSASVRINTDLPENRRYCRPWTARFVADLGHAHTARFSGSSIEVTSAVRTVEYQRRLRLTNGNAAAADGDIASPHLTGGTIDIAKQGMSSKEIGWLRSWLIPLEQAGKIDVEEEFRQSCFHISVYKSYTTPGAIMKPTPMEPLDTAAMMPTPHQ
jgi:hypothetical protein